MFDVVEEQMGLNEEIKRLATFKEWSSPFADKHVLAMTGFYYLGRYDGIQCVFCGVKVALWEANDDEVMEHLKYSPCCPLINGRVTTNKPVNAVALAKILPRVVHRNKDVRQLSTPETSLLLGDVTGKVEIRERRRQWDGAIFVALFIIISAVTRVICDKLK